MDVIYCLPLGLVEWTNTSKIGGQCQSHIFFPTSNISTISKCVNKC